MFQDIHEDIERILQENLHIKETKDTCNTCNLKKKDLYCPDCSIYLCEDCFKLKHTSLNSIHHKYISLTCHCCLSKPTCIYCQDCIHYDFGYLCLDCHLVIHSGKKKNHPFIQIKL